jgi:hypothetical protein
MIGSSQLLALVMSELGFRKGLEALINRESQENGSDTPDWILTEYLIDCLTAFDRAVQAREKWYGRGPHPITEDPPATKDPL